MSSKLELLKELDNIYKEEKLVYFNNKMNEPFGVALKNLQKVLPVDADGENTGVYFCSPIDIYIISYLFNDDVSFTYNKIRTMYLERNWDENNEIKEKFEELQNIYNDLH